MKKSIISILSALMAVMLLGTSCEKTERFAAVGGEPGFETLVLDILDEGLEPSTRSLLTASDIETKKTSVTLAAYTGGKLYARQYYDSGLTAMHLTLQAGDTYNIYALVNMGDMTSAFTDNESSVSAVSYVIPSYTSGSTSVASRGIPMAGWLQLAVTTTTSGTKQIPVKRLLAKVTANLSCSWTGTITGAKVYNMNSTLKPFGGAMTAGSSNADSASDILSFQDIHGTSTGTGSSLNATFYVPENMQGTVSGILNSSSKRPDGGNSTVYGKRNVLTYLETSVTGSGMYSGTITYRSYLGNNATTNFDMARNTHYTWTVTFNEDGTQTNDWKHDNDLTVTKYRLVMSPDYAAVNVGGTQAFVVNRYTDSYKNGSRISAGTVPTAMAASNFNWSSGSTGVATVNSSGTASGVSSGTATITATLKTNVTNYAYYNDKSASAQLTVNDVITYVLEFTKPANTTSSHRTKILAGSAHTAQVTLHTYTNGVLTGSQVLSNGALSWSSSNSSIATVSGGDIIGNNAGDVQITATYTPSGYSTLSATCYISVVTSGWDDDWETGGGEVIFN